MVTKSPEWRDPLVAEPGLNPGVFRAAMARFPTGVALITHGPPETLEAMTINSFVSVSLEPLLVLVSVREDSRIRGRMDGEGPFAVQVLSEEQEHLAALFARRDRPSGAAAAEQLGTMISAAGNALVAGAVACFECTLHGRHPAGDHVLYLGRVIAIHVPFDRQPALLFYRGAYCPARPDSRRRSLRPADIA